MYSSRWPGASLTIIRGHKHLHECAFIGDDSSEELDELLQIAEERGLLNATTAELQLRIAQQVSIILIYISKGGIRIH